MKHRGSWKRLSPEEEVFSVIKAIHRDITAKVPKKQLEEYAVLLRSITYSFEYIEDQKGRFYRAFNLREKVRTSSLVARSPFQRVFEVVAVKLDLESNGTNKSATVQQVFDDFNAHAEFSPAGEILNFNYIDSSMTIYNRALSKNDVYETVAAFDEAGNSPFDSITKMKQIITECKTEKKITWAFLAIADVFKAKLLVQGDLGGQNLMGKAGSKGVLHLLVMKQEMCDYLLNEFIDTLDFDSVFKGTVRSHLKDHASYRKYGAAYPEGPQPDHSWKAGAKTSNITFIELLEGMVYETHYDGPLKLALRYRKVPKEVLEYTEIAAKVEEIKAHLKVF